MKKFTACAAILAFAAVSTSALAAEPVKAKLKTPVPAATKVVAGGAIFNCLGDVCAAAGATGDTGTVSTCKIVAKKVGALESFGSASTPFDAEKLARCNESAGG